MYFFDVSTPTLTDHLCESNRTMVFTRWQTLHQTSINVGGQCGGSGQQRRQRAALCASNDHRYLRTWIYVIYLDLYGFIWIYLQIFTWISVCDLVEKMLSFVETDRVGG